MMTALALITIGALLGVVFVMSTIVWLHDKYSLPIPVVEVAIIVYVTLLALAIGVPVYFWR